MPPLVVVDGETTVTVTVVADCGDNPSVKADGLLQLRNLQLEKMKHSL